jgi:hypothetical protein
MSKNKNVPDQPTPPLVVIKGRQEKAVYLEQQVPDFVGNPLIEALPPLWTLDEVTKLLAYFPPRSEEQRQLPAEVRLHLLENGREFFIPQAQHLEVHLSFSNMIRRGYVQRNPALFGSSKDQHNRIGEFMKGQKRRIPLQSKARGFAIVGQSGVGKSTAVENYLSLYPQVIIHTKYHEEAFLLKQLVWLKLECPREGSIKSLCINFLITVDDILGTNYFERYGAGRRTLDELLAGMIRVASWHYLGVLSIDEIQNLSEAKSGGEAKMINFFVQLENTIGVPFNMIGTPDAHRILMGRFRQARRACEQGAINWQRMKEIDDESEDTAEGEVGKILAKAHPVWEEFIRALWAYQYLRKPQPLDENLLKDKLAHALYEESQGITAVAVTLYFLAQRRTIVRGGDERLTVGTIRTVAKENQHTIRPLLDSLKSGLKSGPYVVPDLVENQPIAIVPKPQNGNGAGDTSQSCEGGQTSEIGTAVEKTESSSQPDVAATQGQPQAAEDDAKKRSKRRGSKRAEKTPTPTYGKGDLRQVASQIAEGISAEEALKQADCVRPADEFLREGTGK